MRSFGVYPSTTLARVVDSRSSRVPFQLFATGVCEGLGVMQHKTQIVAYVRVSSTDQNLGLLQVWLTRSIRPRVRPVG